MPRWYGDLLTLDLSEHLHALVGGGESVQFKESGFPVLGRAVLGPDRAVPHHTGFEQVLLLEGPREGDRTRGGTVLGAPPTVGKLFGVDASD